MALLRAFLLVLAVVLGAPGSHAADVVYPPGSRLGLAPPTGMVTSPNFFGFEDPNTNAAIILASLPIEAYAELEKTINAEALKRQGVTLEKREAISLSTGKAFLVIGRQEIEKTKVRKWILIGSSPALTALVTVQIPETVKNLYSDAAIRETLATLAVRDHVPIEEQLGLLPFKIAELAGFRVGGVVPGRAAVLSDAPADTQAQPQPHISKRRPGRAGPDGRPRSVRPRRVCSHPERQGGPRHHCGAFAHHRPARAPDYRASAGSDGHRKPDGRAMAALRRRRLSAARWNCARGRLAGGLSPLPRRARRD